MNFGWCDSRVDQWDALDVDGWSDLPVCPTPAFASPRPTVCRGSRLSPGYFKEYPYIASVAVGAQTPHSVLLDTGAFVFKRALVSIPSIGGLQWFFGINYQHNSDVDGILGEHFNYPQNVYLKEDPNDSNLVGLFTAENMVQQFNRDASGRYWPAAGNSTASILTRSGAGASDELALHAPEGTVTRFYGLDVAVSEQGRIKSITDRYGNQQTYAWNAQAIGGGQTLMQLTKVTDGYGRDIDYTYYNNDPAAGYRLQEITDFMGRKINFQYESGRLAAIVCPSINSAATGNTFADGTAYVFEYDGSDRLVKIWFPNQCAPHVGSSRTVNVASVRSSATPRYAVTYDGQDRVQTETVGDGTTAGGTYTFSYSTSGLPFNLINPSDTIVSRTTVTDRNGNIAVYDFNAARMVVREEVQDNRSKNSLQNGPYVTWTRYNALNQPTQTVFPDGNTLLREYDDGRVSGITETDNRRLGLLKQTTMQIGNSIGVAVPSGRNQPSNGQVKLQRKLFYDPLFNELCATIEPRGLPVNGSSYFDPQNGGAASAERYAAVSFYDYQEDTVNGVKGDTGLQLLLFPDDNPTDAANKISDLIAQVQADMSAAGLSSGLAFGMGLGDINGDGVTDSHRGSIVKRHHPPVALVGGASQDREEILTVNYRGQVTTHTSPEGNVTVTLRHRFDDPDGGGHGDGTVPPTEAAQQYGWVKDARVDVDSASVASLVGSTGDLSSFTLMVSRDSAVQPNASSYEALQSQFTLYDQLGNVLTEIDPRGHTTTTARTELGEAYRVTASTPYGYRREFYFDANRNTEREDIEDVVVDLDAGEHFTPTGNGTTANLPTTAGSGGSIRSGWFTNEYEYDLLDNKTKDEIDATGSTPNRLTTTYGYDANQNLVQVTKPDKNLIEYDYDERDLRIAQRVGEVLGGSTSTPVTPAVTVWVYDKNGNNTLTIGPADRGGTTATVTIGSAFGGSNLPHTGDRAALDYDGFDRLVQTTNAVGNETDLLLDPDGRTVQAERQGPVNGPGANALLSRSRSRFDEGGREYETQRDVFIASGANPVSGRSVQHTGGGLTANSTANDHTGQVTLSAGGQSYVLSRTVFDRSGRVFKTLADNTGESTSTYDGADRKLDETDPLGNKIGYAYDANSNVVHTVRTEKAAGFAGNDETFASRAWYDVLDRATVTAGQGADGSLVGTSLVGIYNTESLVNMIGFDSRNNRTHMIDPRENTTRTDYDGANRTVQTEVQLRTNGSGTGSITARIATTMAYDANSRQTSITDANGYQTKYEYDTLDRQSVMEFADTSKRQSAYNTASDLTQFTDENGSVFNHTYDSIGRRTITSVTPAAGVVGTTSQTFQYDGLSRSTQSSDASTDGTATVRTFFDSIDRVLEDSQQFGGNTRNQTKTAFDSLSPVGRVYPNDRQVNAAFDVLYRKTSCENEVQQPGERPIAEWKFYGPSRTAEVVRGNEIICSYLNDGLNHSAIQSGDPPQAWGDRNSDRLGYDGAGRLIGTRHLSAVPSVTVRLTEDGATVGRYKFKQVRWNTTNAEWEDVVNGLTDADLGEALERSGLDKIGLDQVVCLQPLTYIDDQVNPAEKMRVYAFDIPRRWLWANLSGETSISANRWEMGWTEVVRTATGFGAPSGRTALSGTAALDPVINSVEANNAATGVQGNGVDIDGTDYPAGFSQQPSSRGGKTVLKIYRQRLGDGTRVWTTSQANADDGTCE